MNHSFIRLLPIFLITSLSAVLFGAEQWGGENLQQNAQHSRQLLDAVKNNNVEQFLNLLESNLDLAIVRSTLLHELAKIADPEKASIFFGLAFGNLPILGTPEFLNAKDEAGNTPLYYAILHPESLKLLLEKGANPNTHNGYFQNTPLHEAVASGNLQSLQYLLATSPDLNAVNRNGRTPYEYAKHLYRITPDNKAAFYFLKNAMDEAYTTPAVFRTTNVRYQQNRTATGGMEEIYFPDDPRKVAFIDLSYEGKTYKLLAPFVIILEPNEALPKFYQAHGSMWRQVYDLDAIQAQQEFHGLKPAPAPAPAPQPVPAAQQIIPQEVTKENVNIPFGRDNETFLHQAATVGNVDRIRELLALGADPRIKNIYDISPYDLAFKRYANSSDPKFKDAYELLATTPYEALGIAENSSPYTVLGINAGATPSEIRKAFLRLTAIWHPDRKSIPMATAAQQLITSAYDTLKK